MANIEGRPFTDVIGELEDGDVLASLTSQPTGIGVYLGRR